MNRRAFLAFTGTLAVAAALGFAVEHWLVGPGVRFEDGDDVFELLAPAWLRCLALLPFFVLAARRSLSDLAPAQRRLGVLLRSVLAALLCLALARPSRIHDATVLSTVFLVDVSASMTDEALAAAQERLDAAWEARGDNDLQLVVFDTAAERIPSVDDAPPQIQRTADSDNRSQGSNLQGALGLAYGLFPPGHLRRAVFISDGIETAGNLLAETTRAHRLGVQLYTGFEEHSVPAEVAIRDLVLPARIRVGQPFTVRVLLASTVPQNVRLRLYQGAILNGLGSVRSVEVQAGETEVEFRSVVQVPGPVTYRASLELEDGDAAEGAGDRFEDNNEFLKSVVVPGRPRVLYVEGARGRADHLTRALTAAEFDVEVRTPRAIPSSARELAAFDFFVLSDVSADQVTLGQLDAIERYVRDIGGGFLFAGGERGYGLGGWQGTRLERMLPVRMDAQRRRDQPVLALALVIDRSGSMSGTKIELAKEAARATAELLGGDDFIEVIGFDSRPQRIVRMQAARNRLRINRDIARLQAGGGTAIFPALDMAYQDLSVTRARIKHVILLTDGQAPEQGITDLSRVMRAEDMTLSTIGLGQDVNRTLLETIARLGGGRSYLTTDPHHIPRIFMRETATVSRSSAVEELFQPQVVARADFLRGIPMASAPYLRGYVATQSKPRPAQVVLQSDLGEPLLARWRLGLGWSMAWTSDVKTRWATDWVRWPAFSRFWAQLIREHMRQRRRQNLGMTATVAGDQVHVVVDAIDNDDRFLNGLDSTLRVSPPLGTQHRGPDAPDAFEVPLRQTAPGRYEARYDAEHHGSFVLTAEHRQDGRIVAESSASLAHPYPLEFANLNAEPERLAEAARITGGGIFDSPEALFDPGEQTLRTHEELWPYLILLCLPLFVLGLLLRRVRLFDRSFSRPSV